MKSWRYRLPVCLLFALLLTAVFGVCARADNEGTCGPNLTWKLENRRLIISGTGEMDDFKEDETVQKPYLWYTLPGTTAPWDGEIFNELVIEEGVTSIGAYAFNCHTELIIVSLPDTLKSIGDSAFAYCENMADVLFPKSVERIGKSVFTDCRGLNSAVLPESLAMIEFGLFQSCNALETVVVPDGVLSIADLAFGSCLSLKEITLPASVVRISKDAFSSCEDLQNVIVEKDSYAEKYCIQYNLPYTYADTPAIYGTCGPDLSWKLEGDSLTISGTGPMDDFYDRESATRGTYTTAPWDEYNFKRIVIEEGVTSVGNLAFFNHTMVTSVELPDTLVSIGKEAFNSCGMAEIRIPDSVSRIRTNAFAICHNLESVTLPDSLDEIEYGMFQSCYKLKDIKLPASVRHIDDFVFGYCGELKEIYLPASLESIGISTFLYCTKLQNVAVEKDSYAEKYCIQYKLPYTYADTPVIFGSDGGEQLEWKLENGTLTISGTGEMDDFTRQFGVTEEITAPWSGQQITQVVIEPGITSVGDYAFWGCGQLKAVTLPDTVTRIGKFAFEGCDLLQEITLPDGIAEIGKKAFSKCGSLTAITLPASVGALGEDVFAGGEKRIKVTVEPGSYAERYCAENGLPYTGGENTPEATPTPQADIRESNTCGENLTWTLENGTLTISGTGRMDDYEQSQELPDRNGTARPGSSAPWSGSAFTALVVEDGVTSIGNYAFEGCGMTEVSLPGTLVSLGEGAFERCENLKTVTLPDSVTEIGMFAFCECTGMTEIRLSASLASIGTAAFQTCVKLTEITLPESLRSAGMYTFLNCSALKTVTLPASLEMMGEYAFEGCQALRNVIVPKDSYAERYCAKKGLSYIYTGSVTEAVPTEAPGGTCGKNLTWRLEGYTLTISGSGEMDDYDSVYTETDAYGSSYFLYTTAPWFGRYFSRVVVENGVTRIGSFAFYSSGTLQSIQLPDTLKSIGSKALSDTALKRVELPDSVESVGREAFFGCSSLEKVKLPAELKVLPVECFYGCVSLREIVLPDTLQSIGGSAFAHCEKLREIRLPASVFAIGNNAFSNCTKLEGYIVEKGSYAEEYCIGKYLPYSYVDGTKPERTVKTVSGTCGRDLTWTLEDGTLTVSGTGEMDDYKMVTEDIYVTGTTAPWGELLIDTVIIEEGVTSVGDYAFADRDEVKQVSLPETLTYLGTNAFASCSITELALPDSISTIGSNVFEGCYHLQKVKLPAGLRCIPFGMFQNCSSLRDITLPESVGTLEEHAFGGCTSLEELRIPAALTDIREYAFEYSPDIKLILAEKGGEAEAYCVSHHITYSYAENE